MRLRWIGIGALALLGSIALVTRLMIAIQSVTLWTPYVVGALAGTIMGATLARHADVKPWREPVLAVLAGFGLALGLAKLLEVRLEVDLTDMVQMIGAALGGAVAGALAIRRWIPSAPVTHAALIVLSALLLAGVSFVMLVVLDINPGLWMLLALVVGGFLTQAVTPVRRPWTCGAGAWVLALIVMSMPHSSVGQAFLGGGFGWLLGALGAALGWLVARRSASDVAVPAARVER